MYRYRISFALAALGFLAVTGCGGGMTTVEGTVSYDGQPVDGGGITLTPAGSKDAVASGKIIAGKYVVSSKADKLPVGKYTVQIVWRKATGKRVKSTADPGQEVDEYLQVIPAEYNEGSKLSVEVTGGSNTANFELKAGAAPPPPGSTPKANTPKKVGGKTVVD